MDQSTHPAAGIALHNAGLSEDEILEISIYHNHVALVTRAGRKVRVPRIMAPDTSTTRAPSEQDEAHILHAIRQSELSHPVFFARVVGDRVELYPVHHDTIIFQPATGSRRRPEPHYKAQGEYHSAIDIAPELQVMTVMQLKALMKRRGILIPPRAKKARLIAILEGADGASEKEAK